MPEDSLVSSFFFILETHGMVLKLFGRILEPYTTTFSEWEREYEYVEGKLKRHLIQWGPTMIALNKARKTKA